MILHRSRTNRSGAYIPEFVLIVIVFFMILFGIIEYGRYVWTYNMLFNAAREGARFAVTHTNTASTTQVQDYVDNYLAGYGVALNGYAKYTNIKVFQANPTTGADNLGGWQNAGQGQAIGIKISGTFGEAVPTLLLMGSSPTMSATVIMYSEAN